MKTNKNLKISRKGSDPLRADEDAINGPKIHKDRSSKRRLSIYDDFSDEEDLDNFDLNYLNDDFDEE
jgi:hypothetical protein